MNYEIWQKKLVLTKHETLHCFLSSGGRNGKEVKIKIKYSLKP